jgi:Raf kinase inhibitor-like YbhB/YbcL family protein
MEIFVSSPDFNHGSRIPKKHTRYGFNWSPQLFWTDPPPGTKSLVVMCECPDAPEGECVHWMVYGLLPQSRQLPRALQTSEQLPSGAMQGKNDLGGTGYDGPAPPPNRHQRYFFKVYALSSPVNIPPGATKHEVKELIRDNILGTGELMGFYVETRPP